MARNYKPWTDKEKALVRRWYEKKGPIQLGELLGRKPKVVTTVANLMGLRRRRAGGAARRKTAKLKYQGRTNLQIELTAACDRYVERLREKPPGLICWLSGGVNAARAEEIKKSIEGRA